MLPRLSPAEVKQLFIDAVPLIDVRAPVEFAEGALPGAVNLPILNDEERAKIGTTYKQQGNEAATALGHRLVSGEVKESRLKLWQQQISQDPRTVLYCFRGGQRSQITQRWLAELGIERPIIAGGYKKIRQELMEYTQQLSVSRLFLVLSGPTGSGKTELIQSLQGLYPLIDLEKLANHRGSAFGPMGTQPTQINFENQLAVEALRLEAQWLSKSPFLRPLLEDESRLIGSRAMPETMFHSLRSSQVVWIEASLEERVEQILKEYVLQTAMGQGLAVDADAVQEVYKKYYRALQAIQKRLGGLKTQEILSQLQFAENEQRRTGELDAHREWIRSLLLHYYDPLYLDSLEKRKPTVAFKGSRKDCREYLLHEVQKWSQ